MADPKTESQHVVPADGKWAVRAENSEQPSKLFDSKLVAISYAFDIAKNHDGKVTVHNSDGTFKDVHLTEETSKFMALLMA